MAILKGFAVLAQVGSYKEGSIMSTNSSLNLSIETDDQTTKDDAEDGVLYPVTGVKYTKAELTVEGKQNDLADKISGLEIGETAECEFVSGKRKYTFTGLIQTLNYTGDQNSDATWQITLASVGKVTRVTIP